ncbi:repeat element 37 protein [Diadegma fenestrale ichnovirus]|nr:repeat element 37 protein [Diadegma fenestrale ichnovirus]
MDFEQPSVPPPSRDTSKIRRILKPFRQIRRWKKVLKTKGSATRKQFLRAVHRNNKVCPEIICNLPNRNLDVTFLDGTPMRIPYIFDPTRRDRDYVLVKLDCILPVFGGVTPSLTEKYYSLIDLCFFVQEQVNLVECQNFRHASCPCHLMDEDDEFPNFVVVPSVFICKYEHFHHFCWKHLVAWLYNYLYLTILAQESKPHFDEEIAHLYSPFPDYISYFQTDERTTPEFLFKTALNFGAAIDENDGE